MANDIQKLLPNIRGLIDSRAEREIFLAFMRVYDYFNSAINEQKQYNNLQLKLQSETITRQTSLINGFGTKLIGLTELTNPLIELGNGTITQVSATPTAIFNVTNASTTPSIDLKTQAANKVLVGPTSGVDAIPTFRLLVAADFGTIPTNPNILDWIAQ